jgi:hypothetical protein
VDCHRNTQTLRLVYPERGSFAYALDGTFIDRMKWLAAGLMIGDIRTVETLLGENRQPTTPGLATQIQLASASWRHKITNTNQ